MNFDKLPENLEFPSDVDDLKEILTTVEPRLQPIPRIRRHVSRFVDGADMDEVYPHLWLGDCDAATNKPYLQRHGITHILNAADNKTGPARVKTGEEFYEDISVSYMGLDLIDLPFANAAKYFEDAANFIDIALSSGGIVFVHCRQGRSRSASIVIAFLMLCRNYTSVKALRRIREIREVRPNNSFLQQLVDLDLQIFRERLEIYKRHHRNSFDSSDSDSELGKSISDSPSETGGSVLSISDRSSIVSQEDSSQEEATFETCLEYSTEASIVLFDDDIESGNESDDESGLESSGEESI